MAPADMLAPPMASTRPSGSVCAVSIERPCVIGVPVAVNMPVSLS